MSANDRAKSEILAELRARLNEPFNQPAAAANFDHWIKAPYWTPEEAIALALGKEPFHLKLDTVVGYWEKHQQSDSAGLVERYADLGDLARRAIAAGELDQEQIVPTTFVAWAKQRQISYPRELDVLLGESPVDEKGADDAAARIEELEREVAELRDEARRLKQSENAKIRKSLQKLVLGMAVTKFQFDSSKRSSAATNIADKLLQIGIQIDRDTVLRRLQEAADEIEYVSMNS